MVKKEIPVIIHLNGVFDDQKGTVQKLRTIGYNVAGIPCRKYKWIKPFKKELKGKKFDAWDSQILKWMTEEPLVDKTKCRVCKVKLTKENTYTKRDETQSSIVVGGMCKDCWKLEEYKRRWGKKTLDKVKKEIVDLEKRLDILDELKKEKG